MGAAGPDWLELIQSSINVFCRLLIVDPSLLEIEDDISDCHLQLARGGGGWVILRERVAGRARCGQLQFGPPAQSYLLSSGLSSKHSSDNKGASRRRTAQKPGIGK